MTPVIDKLLFSAASSLAGRDERRAFLEYACRGEQERLQRLVEMLEIQQDADEFFDLQPTMENSAPAADEDGGIGARIGPYRLIERLGSGGCGVVYLAEQLSPVKRKVALKIIRLGMDTENVIARFSIEREALALMDHPNIARVLDAGNTASGRPYFVMELVDGEKITDFCDRKKLGLGQRLDLFIMVCEAIQHAHQKGVIHRDIKPSNILVREHDGRAEPKVIDFGIAKATLGEFDASATVTQYGQFIGTPAYMSPEQADGGMDIDTRSDIYSLGALLCELLTGSPPFRVDQFNERNPEEIRSILRDVETGMPSTRLRNSPQVEIGWIAENRNVDPHRLPSLLAGDLDWVVLKAIEKDRQRRYETADGLAMDVRRYQREEPVLARPPSRRYHFTKMVRRNRATFVAGGIALFGLLGGLGTATWLFLREREARQEQARLRDEAERARTSEIHLRQCAEALDAVAKAAVFLRYKEMEQGDALLSGMPAERVPHTLESAKTLMAIANWNLTQQHWKTAAERFYLLAHVLTSVDMTDTKQISYDLIPALTAVCEWGEPGQYEIIRSLVVKRFANSANPVVVEQVLKSTLLKPADKETLDVVCPLAPIIEKANAEPTADPHMIAWRCFSLSLLAYRNDDLERAGDWARKSLAAADTSPYRAEYNRIILAMVDLKQGRIPAARLTIAGVRQAVDHWSAEPFRLQEDEGISWFNWEIVRVLLNEAEKMQAKTAD